jgi:hypothetical protein
MPRVTHEIHATVGQSGSGGRVKRLVGHVFVNQDGRMFIRLDAFFNFGALARKEGADAVFLACAPVNE